MSFSDLRPLANFSAWYFLRAPCCGTDSSVHPLSQHHCTMWNLILPLISPFIFIRYKILHGTSSHRGKTSGWQIIQNLLAFSPSIYFHCRKKILSFFLSAPLCGFWKVAFLYFRVFFHGVYDTQLIYKNEWATVQTYWCWCMNIINLIWQVRVRWQTSYNLATVSEDCFCNIFKMSCYNKLWTAKSWRLAKGWRNKNLNCYWRGLVVLHRLSHWYPCRPKGTRLNKHLILTRTV